MMQSMSRVDTFHVSQLEKTVGNHLVSLTILEQLMRDLELLVVSEAVLDVYAASKTILYKQFGPRITGQG